MILNKLLFIIPLAILLLPIANAEKIEINVPFESHGYSCTIEDSINELTYTCIFEGNIQTFTIQDLKEFESILTENQINEIIQKLEQEELKKITESKITPNDRLILKLEQKQIANNIDSQEIVLLQMIKELELCYNGLGKSKSIQTYNEFEISTYLNYQNNHVKIESEIGNLIKNMEACKAQNTLENDMLSEKYRHLAVFMNVPAFSLQSHYEGLSSMPFEKLRSTTNNIDMSVICDSNQHTRQYKDLMDCPPIQYDGYYLDKNNGFISHYSPILEEYTFFMQDYGDRYATEKSKQIEADKAEIIKEEILKENLWYYR